MIMYTDETMLTFGKYKFMRLCRVPADYLLLLFKNKSIDNPELMEYIQANYSAICSRQEGIVAAPELKLTCSKMTYPNEKDAKYFLKTLRNVEQKHKKPIRAYECELCGSWHVTSTEKFIPKIPNHQ